MAHEARRFRAPLAATLLVLAPIAWWLARGPAEPSSAAFSQEPPKQFQKVAWLRLGGSSPEVRPAGNEIRDLTLGPSGALWVATNAGLSRLSEGQFRHFTSPAEGLPDQQVYALAVAADAVIAATKGGLVLIRDPLLPSSGIRPLKNKVFAPAVFRSGDHIWAVWRDGEQSFIGDLPMEKGETFRERPLPKMAIRRFLPAGEEEFLYSTPTEGWWVWTKDRTSVRWPRPAPPLAALSTQFGTLILTQSELLLRRAGTALPDLNLILRGQFSCLGTIGRNQKSVWIGGVGRLIEIDFSSGTPRPARMIGLPPELTATAVTEDLLGRIWLGTDRGLYIADPDRSRVIEWVQSPEQTGATSVTPHGMGEEPFPHSPREVGFLDGEDRLWAAGGTYVAVEEPNSPTLAATSAPREVGYVSRNNDYWFVDPTCYSSDLEDLEFMDELGPVVHRLEALLPPSVSPNRIDQLDYEDDLLEILRRDGSPALWEGLKRESISGKFPVIRTCHVLDGLGGWYLVKTELGVEVYRGSKNAGQLPSSPSVRDISTAVARTDGVIIATGMPLRTDRRQVPIVWRVDNKLRAENLSRFLVSSEQADPERVSAFSSPGGEPRILLHWLERILELGHGKDGRTWSPVIHSQVTSRSQIVALSFDQTGELIAGCRGCGKYSLFRIDKKGRPTPLNKETDGSGEVEAILHDTSGRLWVAKDRRLTMQEARNGPFLPVLGVERSPLPAGRILEFPPGNLWVAGGERGLWQIEGGSGTRQAAKPRNRATVLAGVGTKIWIGGPDLLGSYDYSTEHFQRYELQQIFGSLPVTVKGIAGGSKVVFILTDLGLVKVDDPDSGALSSIDLPDWSEISGEMEDGGILRRTNGDFVIFGSMVHRNTLVWTLRGEEEPKVTVTAATVDRIHSMSENTRGELFFGAEYGRVLALGERRIELVANLLESTIEQGRLVLPLRGFCPFGSDRVLLLGQGRFPFSSSVDLENKAKYGRRLDVMLPPWSDCAELTDSRLLLFSPLERDQVTVVQMQGDQIASVFHYSFEDRLHQMAVASAGAVFLGAKNIWKLHPNSDKPEKIGKTPPELSAEAARARMAVSQKGDVWIGTTQRLWWHPPYPESPRKATPDDGWKAWDEVDGLPSRITSAIVATGHSTAIVFTPTGYYRITKAPSTPSGIRIELPSEGYIGNSVNAAEIFKIDGHRIWAVGTEQGVSLAYWPTGNPDDTMVWSHLDRSNGLTPGMVRSMRWVPRQKQLWVGTDSGVTVFECSMKEGRAVGQRLRTINEAQDLPRGLVRDISVSPDGVNAWILSGGRLSRWTSTKERVIASSETFLLANTTFIRLGPALNETPPRLLIEHSPREWSVWNISDYTPPKLPPPKDWIFWIKPQLEEEGLSPRTLRWEVAYSIDRPAQETSGWSRVFPRQLWLDSSAHLLVASLTRPGDRAPSHILSVPIPASGRGLQALRLVLVAVVLGGVLFLSVGSWVRRSRRQKRLRRQDIPYIQGEAIQDASQFFGRRRLLESLRDTLPNASWALIGEFRIGKTSIQLQLGNLLRSVRDDQYVFFPVFIDLEHLEGQRGRFFHFIGRHVMTLAREQGLPQEVLDRLLHPRTEPSTYDSLSLSDDLTVLIAHWTDKLSPRLPILVLQIDEISLMDNLDYNTLLALRGIFVSQPLVKTVLSGRELPQRTGNPRLSPWWNFIGPEQIVEVEPLTPPEARELIVEPVRGLFTFEADAIDHLIARSEGKPLVLQSLCSDLLRYKYSTGRLSRRITLKDFRRSIEFGREGKRKMKEAVQ